MTKFSKNNNNKCVIVKNNNSKKLKGWSISLYTYFNEKLLYIREFKTQKSHLNFKKKCIK